MNGQLTVGSLFSGVGLLDYGLHLAGLEHAWFCEQDEWRQGILRQRWPGCTVHGDVREAGAAWGRVDVVAGGFPCKGISSAGGRTGFDHPETVLWREMARCIRDVRPRYVLVENVADLLHLRDGELFGEVLGDLASIGYDTAWDCLPASAFGAPHRRDRVFVTAHAPGLMEREPADQANPIAGSRDTRQEPRRGAGFAQTAPDSGNGRLEGVTAEHGPEPQEPEPHADGPSVSVDWGEYAPAIRRWEDILGRRAPEPIVRGVDAGPAGRVVRSRLSALGDGVQVQAGCLLGQMIVEHHLAHLSAERAAA